MIKFTDEELEYIGYAIDNYEPFDYDNKKECELCTEIQRKLSNYFVFKMVDENTYKEDFWTYAYTEGEIEEDIKFYPMYDLKEVVRVGDKKYEEIKNSLKRDEFLVENPIFTYWELKK